MSRPNAAPSPNAAAAMATIATVDTTIGCQVVRKALTNDGPAASPTM